MPEREWLTNISELGDGRPQHGSLQDICRKLCPEVTSWMPASAYDLLEACFALDPRERITATEAKEHPFFHEQNKA